MWIGGVSIGLLAASGIVASVNSFPVTYVVTADEVNAHGDRDLSAGRNEAQVGRAQARDAQAPAAATRRSQFRCPECGVVKSVRPIERAGEAAADATTAAGVMETTYEVTVRLRDGSTMVFNAVGPHGWRPGSRIIVIAGAEAPSR
ncbi:MAG: hypothetical protein IT521_13765 [Burkholderiales bacterium]|nr:hypothetical protein [Burkholderiales bacterium]